MKAFHSQSFFVQSIFGFISFSYSRDITLAIILNFVDRSIRSVSDTDSYSARSMVNSISEDRKIAAWQKEVAQSTADNVSTTTREVPPARSNPPPFVVNQIVSNQPVVVTRVRAPEPKASEEISTKAIIGTMVGATAGAFIAYAMVKGDSENHQQPEERKSITYRTIEVPAYEAKQPKFLTQIPIQDAYQPYDSPTQSKSSPYTIASGRTAPKAQAFIPASASQQPRHPGYSGTQNYSHSSRDGPIIMIDNERDSRSRASLNRHPVKQKEYIKSTLSAPGTEVRIARDVPLPTYSQASHYSKSYHTTSKRDPAPLQPVLPPIAPEDSISQVSSRGSKQSGRTKHHHTSHHGGSKLSAKGEGSKASKGKVGDMMDDVVNLIKGSSVKGSEHRSVRA